MANISTIVTVHGGMVRIPADLEADSRFRDGARVKLESIEPVERAQPASRADWQAFEGMFADPRFDTTDWKRQEREFELAHDERKFGTKRPGW